MIRLIVVLIIIIIVSLSLLLYVICKNEGLKQDNEELKSDVTLYKNMAKTFELGLDKLTKKK